MSVPSAPRRRALYASSAALLVAATGIVALWLSLAKSTAPEIATLSGSELVPVRVELAPAAVRTANVWDEVEGKPAPTSAAETAQASDEPEHPHPITSEHVRLRRERGFIIDLDEAMDRRDGASLRRALDGYRREFPEDEQRLQAGYGVVADCLERPGAESRGAAQRFYDANRASTLRRWVRRVCLES